MIALCAAIAAACALMLAWPMDLHRFLAPQGSGLILDRNGNVLYAFLDRDDAWRFPRELDAISPRLIEAVIAAEDQRYYRHIGVDPAAIARAAWQNLRARGIVSGASTITMQVVKQTAGRDRTAWGKLRQAVQALRLECRVDKRAILASYLNGAPYGGNLVGCEAAARRYFGKAASNLDLAEAALLAGLPKAPSALMPLHHPEAALERRAYVLARMRDEGYIGAADCARAQAAPLNVARHDFPALAPHLALQFREECQKTGAPIGMTLDAALQTRAERIVREHVQRYAGQITNAAAIVVDVPHAAVLARVGSADFANTPGGGQVDSCRAARSPGSALKPFAYALALESNALYPSEALLDGALDYGAYQPVNFDGRMHGLVEANVALRRSLNIPAVMVLERIGCSAFHSFLRDAGLTTLTRPADHYGMGLVLGNCEMRLEEAAAAYCMLASLGIYRPLAVRPDAQQPSMRLLAPGTCLSVYEMLEQPLPKEFDPILVPVTHAARVAWKTGTSTGLRDAWAFVFNAQYVVATWMGNNTGASSRSLIGAYAALPLAAELFRSLPPGLGPARPDAKDELRSVNVCAVTGLPATPWCAATRHENIPRTLYLNRTCGVHFPAPNKDGSGNAPPSVTERWPASARHWDLARVAMPVVSNETPPGTGLPPASSRGETLRILTPADGTRYVLTGEANGDRIRMTSSADAQTAVHWYVDGRYLGTSRPDAPRYLDLAAGRHVLTCMTGDGHLHTVGYAVTAPKALGNAH